MIGSEHREITAFVEEMRRYLKSGNEVPVTRVTLPAGELQRLLDYAESMLADIECGWYED